jgi:hypothetical protein
LAYERLFKNSINTVALKVTAFLKSALYKTKKIPLNPPLQS